MVRVVYHEAAIEDLEGLASYIASDNPLYARVFVAEIQELCQRLADYPFSGQERSDLSESLRSFPCKTYVVYYVPSDYGVDIVRILHSRRDVSKIF